MLKKRTPLLVGLLVVAVAATFLVTLGRLDRGVDLESAYPVEAVFDDVTGLVEDSRVMLAGIPVGQIQSIRLDETDPSKARVTLLIEDRVELHEGIWDPQTKKWVNGAVVTRLQASLLGDYYIGITPGLAGPVLPPGGEVKNVVNESGLTRVVNQLEESISVIFPRLEQITDDIGTITRGVRESFAGEDATKAIIQIRENARTTSQQVAELSTELRSYLNQNVFGTGDTVRSTLENLEKASGRFDALAGKLDGRMDAILANMDVASSDLRAFIAHQTAEGSEDVEGTVAHTLASIDRSVAKLEGTAESAQAVMERIEGGQGTLGRLMTDSKLIDDLEGVVEDVRGLTGTFGRLQVKVDFRSDFLFEQSQLKNTVAVSFFPKPDKFYHFALVSDPQGLTLKKHTVITGNDPSLPPVLVQDETTTESKLKLTAQFGKKWHWLTLRYGVMESTGGLGIDLDLLEDAFAIQVDAFDFGRDDFPRVRMLAAWEFAKHLYVAGGIDDVLNGDARDYFFGLGVSFADDDLKSLLPILPSGF